MNTRSPLPGPLPLPAPDPRARDLVLDFTDMDAPVADLVQRELKGRLDDGPIATLRACVTDLDRLVPLIDSAYCAFSFAILRTTAVLAAADHTHRD
ncbi:hypothetical protein AB0I39_14305 [Kitasatospora purpeofusca]|uniref:hypothetical protein n=1 Tax=Kitasatospora purpeofusca TaxID=67352 RepID=UPI0033E31A40